MSAFTIRPASIDDAPGMADTIVESWKWAYAGVVPDEMIAKRSDKAEREEVTRRNWKPERAFLVAEDPQGRVIGFVLEGTPVSFPDFDCEIAGLYVHPVAARQGVGRSLMLAAIQVFAERGCRRLCLHTLGENKIGRGFYDKMGGQVFRADEWNGIPAVWYGWDDVLKLITEETPSE